MSKSIKTYEEAINAGYGQGNRENYKPCKTVQNFSSIGRSHRVKGHVSKRLHHLFSDLELCTFLLLDWNQNVTDIREHYPLNPSEIKSICSRYRIKQASIEYFPFTISIDFLVDFGNFMVAIDTLYSESLNKSHIIEQLEIKRRYWEERNTEFKFITEKEIPSTVLKNIQWLYAEKNNLEITTHLIGNAVDIMKEILNFPNTSLIIFCKHMDQIQKLDLGSTLSLFRKLFAVRLLEFNLRISYLDLQLSDISASDLLNSENTINGTY